jgi:hypothetical protein
MTYYGRFRHSVLHPQLGRINYHVEEWIRAKYRRLRPCKAIKRAWVRITAQMPGLLPHWRWETRAKSSSYLPCAIWPGGLVSSRYRAGC